MDGIELKKIWKSSKQSYGAWLCSVDPIVASVMCNIGFDWMIIDTEHHCYNLGNITGMKAQLYHATIMRFEVMIK